MVGFWCPLWVLMGLLGGGGGGGRVIFQIQVFFFKLRFSCGLICDEWGVGNLTALVTVEHSWVACLNCENDMTVEDMWVTVEDMCILDCVKFTWLWRTCVFWTVWNSHDCGGCVGDCCTCRRVFWTVWNSHDCGWHVGDCCGHLYSGLSEVHMTVEEMWVTVADMCILDCLKFTWLWSVLHIRVNFRQWVTVADMCILDCLHLKAERTFYILDLMHWKQLPYYQSEVGALRRHLVFSTHEGCHILVNSKDLGCMQ